MNKMGHSATHLMGLMTGPKGCLPKIAREIWMRRHQWMPWLGHDETLNVGNDWRMTLQRVTEKLWIWMQKMNWQRLFKLRTANTEFRNWA